MIAGRAVSRNGHPVPISGSRMVSCLDGSTGRPRAPVFHGGDRSGSGTWTSVAEVHIKSDITFAHRCQRGGRRWLGGAGPCGACRRRWRVDARRPGAPFAGGARSGPSCCAARRPPSERGRRKRPGPREGGGSFVPVLRLCRRRPQRSKEPALHRQPNPMLISPFGTRAGAAHSAYHVGRNYPKC